MKVLHFTLGLPPYRTGGLTKYSVDLMLSQVKEHEVFLIYPGRYKLNSKLAVKRNRAYKEINVYEILNPLPVSLLNGINDITSFTKSADPSEIRRIYNEIQPDIIHIHTLMGIHKEWIQVAKERGIKTVFTTHDYFGICPMVNLINSKGELCNDYDSGKSCISCNRNALSMSSIHILQSGLYKMLKDSSLMKRLRKRKKGQLTVEKKQQEQEKPFSYIETEELAEQYVKLREYYKGIFNLVDGFHFNSTVAKQEFTKYVQANESTISITHGDIRDNRVKKVFNKENKLRISYLGPISKPKGFFFLKECLDGLIEIGRTDWHLNVYGDTINNLETYTPNHYTFHGRYEYGQLADIFKATDLLIIPSVWKETFGFIGLEALSYGVPIMTTEYVGFKDLLENGKTGLVIKARKSEFINEISRIIQDRTILEHINKEILDMNFSYTVNDHTNEITNLYNRVRSEVGV